MSELKEYKLGDLGFFFGGVTSIKKEDYGHGTPFLPYKNVYKNSKVNVNELELMNVRPLDLDRRNAVYGDIFFTASSETPDEVAMSSVLLDEVENLTFNGFCKRFRLNDFNTLLPEYARYLFRDISFRREVYQLATGDIRFNISQESLANIEIEIPNTATQKQIAQILSSLDDKIELNLQMNQTLEAVAQAIFKEWFVNFNFPGFDGELVDGLPKGWRMGVLSDVIEFTNGFAFKSTDLLDYPEYDCFHVFKMGNINKGGGFNYEGTKSYFKKADADKLGKYILRKGDLLMCMTDMKDNVALLGHTALMNQDDKFLVNQRVGLLRPNNKLSIDYPYLYILTNYPEFIKELRSRANRGVQVNLSTSEIKNTKIVIPEKNVNVQFDELAKPVFEKIFANIENIQELTQTRDTLLPKLISGQLEVV